MGEGYIIHTMYCVVYLHKVDKVYFTYIYKYSTVVLTIVQLHKSKLCWIL